MALAHGSAPRTAVGGRALWSRPEPHRFFRLTWPAVCGWGVMALCELVFVLEWSADGFTTPLTDMVLWLWIGVGVVGALLGWLSLAYAVVSLVSKGPLRVRLLAAAVNLTPIAASLAGYYFRVFFPLG